ncbi:MAG: hypothetical protein Q9187_002874, partial [Circinaria calcarea]
ASWTRAEHALKVNGKEVEDPYSDNAVEKDRNDGCYKDGVPDPVDPLQRGRPFCLLLVVDLQEQDQEDQGGASNRQIDVENPAPRNVLNDQATKYRSQCSPKGDQAKDQSQVVPSLSQGHQITHDNFDQDVNATSTDALDRSTSNQHVNVTGPAADAAAESKNGRGDNDRIASSENIGQLSIKRLKGSPVGIRLLI